MNPIVLGCEMVKGVNQMNVFALSNFLRAKNASTLGFWVVVLWKWCVILCQCLIIRLSNIHQIVFFFCVTFHINISFGMNVNICVCILYVCIHMYVCMCYISRMSWMILHVSRHRANTTVSLPPSLRIVFKQGLFTCQILLSNYEVLVFCESLLSLPRPWNARTR